MVRKQCFWPIGRFIVVANLGSGRISCILSFWRSSGYDIDLSGSRHRLHSSSSWRWGSSSSFCKAEAGIGLERPKSSGPTRRGTPSPLIGSLLRTPGVLVPSGQKKDRDTRSSLFWCPGGDSNPHTSRYQILNLACLPIPPPRHLIIINFLMFY